MTSRFPGRPSRAAVRALMLEVSLPGKPGLVSPGDAGAHHDMDARTFVRSAFALRGYFRAIEREGERGAPFERLRALGMQAEGRMLGATGGVNTHRGAIFSLGLLTAAAARLGSMGCTPTPERLALHVRNAWGHAILAPHRMPCSHGDVVRQRYGAAGARGEAAAGFPTVVGSALPALREARRGGATAEMAATHVLFTVMAALEDTNVLYRAGSNGAALVRRRASAFLEDGSVFQLDWRHRVRQMHREFVARRISPGGAADMLAATLFVDMACTGATPRAAGGSAQALQRGHQVREALALYDHVVA